MLIPPILDQKHYSTPSVFSPSALLREARRQRRLPQLDVPEVCILDPDGDLVRQIRERGLGRRFEPWACYHTELDTFALAGRNVGIVGRVVGASFGQSARQYSRRRPPQIRDIGRCFPTWCVRGEVGLHAGCRSSYKSGQPSCGASIACRKTLPPSRCFEPSDAPAGHIGELKYEDLHEVGWGRDIANL